MFTRDFCIRLGLKLCMSTLCLGTSLGLALNIVYNDSLTESALHSSNVAIVCGATAIMIMICTCHICYSQEAAKHNILPVQASPPVARVQEEIVLTVMPPPYAAPPAPVALLNSIPITESSCLIDPPPPYSTEDAPVRSASP